VRTATDSEIKSDGDDAMARPVRTCVHAQDGYAKDDPMIHSHGVAFWRLYINAPLPFLRAICTPSSE